jgi:hypothetical protein
MNTIIKDPMSLGFKDSGQPVLFSRAWPLRACLKNGWLVAQATRLCRPATRPTEWNPPALTTGLVLFQACSPRFRSAGYLFNSRFECGDDHHTNCAGPGVFELERTLFEAGVGKTSCTAARPEVQNG